MTSKQIIRIFIFIIAGVLVSFGVISLMITVGYAQTYTAGANQSTVTFFGMPIYEIHRVGNTLRGDVTENIGVVGLVVGVIFVIIAETFTMWIGKRRSAKKSNIAILEANR